MCSCVQVFTVFSFPKYILIKNIWRFFSDSVNNIYSVLFDKDKNEDKEVYVSPRIKMQKL